MICNVSHCFFWLKNWRFSTNSSKGLLQSINDRMNKIQKQLLEVFREKKTFFKISQNLQETTCAKFSCFSCANEHACLEPWYNQNSLFNHFQGYLGIFRDISNSERKTLIVVSMKCLSKCPSFANSSSCPKKFLVAHLHSGIILFAKLFIWNVWQCFEYVCLGNCSVNSVTLCYALYQTDIFRIIVAYSALWFFRYMSAYLIIFSVIKAYPLILRHF